MSRIALPERIERSGARRAWHQSTRFAKLTAQRRIAATRRAVVLAKINFGATEYAISVHHKFAPVD